MQQRNKRVMNFEFIAQSPTEGREGQGRAGKRREAQLCHWLLNLTSPVIGLSRNLSQSQPSVSNFQFPKSKFSRELHIHPPYRWENKSPSLAHAINFESALSVHGTHRAAARVHRHPAPEHTGGNKSIIIAAQHKATCSVSRTTLPTRRDVTSESANQLLLSPVQSGSTSIVSIRLPVNQVFIVF